MTTMTAAPARQKVLEGTGPVSEQVRVTPKGVEALARALKKELISV